MVIQAKTGILTARVVIPATVIDRQCIACEPWSRARRWIPAYAGMTKDLFVVLFGVPAQAPMCAARVGIPAKAGTQAIDRLCISREMWSRARRWIPASAGVTKDLFAVLFGAPGLV